MIAAAKRLVVVELGLTAGSNRAFNLNRQLWQGRIAEPSEVSVAARPAVAPYRHVDSRAFANDPLDLHAQ